MTHPARSASLAHLGLQRRQGAQIGCQRGVGKAVAMSPQPSGTACSLQLSTKLTGVARVDGSARLLLEPMDEKDLRAAEGAATDEQGISRPRSK
jgi:hypothetical protein